MDDYFVFTNCYVKRLSQDVITRVEGELALLQMSYNFGGFLYPGFLQTLQSVELHW